MYINIKSDFTKNCNKTPLRRVGEGLLVFVCVYDRAAFYSIGSQSIQ